MTATAQKKLAVGVLVLTLVLAVTYLFGPGGAGASPTTLHQASSADAGADSITVTGTGRVAGTPDTLRADLRVESKGADVTAALARAGAAATRVTSALTAKGVAAKDIATSTIGLAPTSVDTKTGPKVVGYTATETLSMTLQLSSAGVALTAAVAAGGNDVRIDNASLEIVNDGALVRSARAEAFADAEAKAQQYADLAGRPLAAVSSVSEDVGGPIPLAMARLSVTEAAASVPISPGTQDVTVSVQVVWSLR